MSASLAAAAVSAWRARDPGFTRDQANSLGNKLAKLLEELLAAYQARLDRIKELEKCRDDLTAERDELANCREALELWEPFVRGQHELRHPGIGWAVCDDPICREVTSNW